MAKKIVSQKKSKKNTRNLCHIDLSPYRSLIEHEVYVNYWKLPVQEQNAVSREDCESEITLYILEVLTEEGGKYDSSKATFKVWLRKIISNYFINFVKAYYRTKRLAVGGFVALDDPNTREEYFAASVQATAAEIREAREHVISLHRLASRDLLEYLDRNLYHCNKPWINVRSNEFYKRRDEFRDLAKRTNTTIDHYRLALHTDPQ